MSRSYPDIENFYIQWQTSYIFVRVIYIDNARILEYLSKEVEQRRHAERVINETYRSAVEFLRPDLDERDNPWSCVDSTDAIRALHREKQQSISRIRLYFSNRIDKLIDQIDLTQL